MLIRAYQPEDAEKTLRVFSRAVRVTAGRDYTATQVAVWAQENRSITSWHEARAAANTRVAEVQGELAGFIDASPEGYLDMLFVDPTHSRTGVASALLQWAEATAREARARRLCTHASITARPFFEAHGFVVEEECFQVLRGVQLRNYRMSRYLDAAPR